MNKKDIVLISEFISAPFDEGLKNVLFNIMSSLQKNYNTVVVTGIDNNTNGLDIKKIKLNKLFLNIRLYSLLQETSPGIILYVPEASSTFNSFFRAKVLKLMCRHSRVVMLGAQHRTYSSVQALLISILLIPDMLFLLSKKNESFYRDKGISVRVLPPAVDSQRFCAVEEEEKKSIRERYKVPLDQKIILHVGHIKANRNIECLLKVQKLEGTQVVIVGSTSFAVENDLKDRLAEAGVVVIDKFVPDISEIYKMSDVYVFPVMNNLDSIDMPMSILEAMACNLPVLTTRFGGLVDNFKEDSGFGYFDTTEELVSLVTQVKGIEKVKVNNDKKIGPFTWDRFTNKIINACGELV